MTAADTLPLVPDEAITNATQTITVNRQILDHLYVTNISDPQDQGTPSAVVVMARDAEGYLVDWYDGTVSFSSDDPGAMLPDGYTFNPAKDRGSKTFTNMVAFGAPGEKIVRAYDSGTNSDGKAIEGQQIDITVQAGNTAPVAELRFTQPASPVALVQDVASQPLTLQLFDEAGLPTTAPVGGMPIHVSSTSPTALMSLSPYGPWTSVLDVNIPEGFTFLNVYYKDSSLGPARISATDWIDATDDDAIANTSLDVEVNSIRVEGNLTIRTKNAFGQLEESAILFAHDSEGSIEGAMDSNFTSYSLHTELTKDVAWRWYWREGVRLRSQDFALPKTAAISKSRDSIVTKVGGDNWYTTAEATDTTFDKPEEVVSRELEIPVGRHTVSISASEYAVAGEAYSAAVRTDRLFEPTPVDTVVFYVVPADATDTTGALYQETVSPTEAVSTFTVPADLAALAVLGSEYRLFAVSQNAEGETTAQALSAPFTVVASIPESPVVPDEETSTNPTMPVEETTQAPPTVPAVGSQSPVQLDTETPPVEKGTPAQEYVKQTHINASEIATIYGASILIVVLLLREAYKEIARVHRLRGLLERQHALVVDKQTFLSLSAHYLRTPLATLEAALGMSSENSQTLSRIVMSVRRKAEALLSESAADPQLTSLVDPDIAKATRQAYLSVIFWLPVILSVVLTIVINQTIGAIERGNVFQDATLYGGVITVALLLMAFFSWRTIHINRERTRMEHVLDRHRRQLFAAKARFISQAERELRADIYELRSINEGEAVRANSQMHGYIESSIRKLDDLAVKLRLIGDMDGVVTQSSAFSANALVDHVLRRHQDKIEHKHLRVQTELQARAPVRQDARLLQYVLSTVVDNAVKFSRNTSTLHVSAVQRRGSTTLRVEDEGAELTSPANEERMFEAFNHATDAGGMTADGMGLSLYLDRMIMNHLGGEIRARRSRHGKGATIEIRFQNAAG